jgi:tetratricopeptide (TPR) repeat protein
MTTLRSLTCLGALVVTLASDPARAVDAPLTAREHFRKGQTHYALGEFLEAAKSFKEAYRLRDEPAILFNIGQAMRMAGDSKQAIFYYKQYLARKVAPPNRPEVEALINDLGAKLAEQRRVEGKPGPQPASAAPPAPAGPQAPTGADAPAVEAPEGEVQAVAARPAVPAAALAAPAPSTGTSGTRIAGYAALGTGAAVGGLAFLFHSSAQSAADELSRKYNAGTLQTSDAHLKSDVDSKGRMATFSAIGSAVLIAAGAAAVFAF